MKYPAVNRWMLVACFVGLVVGLFSACAGNWPGWRGENASGVSEDASFPSDWDATKNVRWRTALPDRGNSSPIVWGNRVFVSQAIEKDNKRLLLCIDRANGKILWEKGVVYDKAESKHETNTYCASTPVTDGKRVFVSFASAGFYCYDFDGNELWHRDLGKNSHQWGDGASPVLKEGLCVFYHGPGEGSYLVALDQVTGRNVWKYDEPKAPAAATREDGFKGNANGMVGSFSTPIVVEANGRFEVVMSFPEVIRAFDLKTGKELWYCDGLNPLVYCSVIDADGVLVAMGGYFGAMVAVRSGGSGDVSKTHKVWQSGRTPHRLGTGVVAGKHVYVFDRAGMAQCISLESGESLWQERVRGEGANSAIWGSAVLGGDKIYTVNQSGDVLVLRANPEFELLSANSLGEKSNATPALSDSEIFIRTDEALWCLAENLSL